jgi:3-oxoacyl-[acyl-carrier-protein] synthase-3
MSIGMQSIVTVFPEERVGPEDYRHVAPRLPPGLVPPREKRRFADPHANEIMALEVARKAMDAAGVTPADVDLIVCQSFGGRFIVPGLAGYVHKQLGFQRATPAWNVQNICASFVDGCEIAWNSIRGNDDYRTVLVMAVSALETGGWGTDPSHPVAAMMGDGAGATVIGSNPKVCEFLSYTNQTYGEIYEPAVMAFDPPDHPEELVGTRFVINKGAGPHITPEFDELVFTVFRRMIVDAANAAVAKARMTLNDLDIIVVHQAFPGMTELWMGALEEVQVPRSKWRTTWDKYGNVGAVDVPATLADLHAGGGIPKDANVMLFAPGGGGHTPTMIVRWRA